MVKVLAAPNSGPEAKTWVTGTSFIASAIAPMRGS